MRDFYLGVLCVTLSIFSVISCAHLRNIEVDLYNISLELHHD